MQRKKYTCRCGKDINPKRHLLGYNNCLTCGEQSAQQQNQLRNRSVMPMHKSNYVLIIGGDIASQKRNIKDLTGKNGA